MHLFSCLVSHLPQVQQKVSEVEVREKELFDWRKKVSEVECTLAQQENLLECAVKERNLYSRNLIEAQVQLLQWLPLSHSLLLVSLCNVEYSESMNVFFDPHVFPFCLTRNESFFLPSRSIS